MATQAQLNQAAANMATSIISAVKNGTAADSGKLITDLAYCVLALVQYNANNGSATINLPSQFSGNVSLTGVAITPRTW